MTGYDILKKYEGKFARQDYIELNALLKSMSIRNDITIDVRQIPWCAAMVNACEREVGHKGTGHLNARSFLKYGTVVELKDAKEGDIVIFTRGADGWSGHVAYYVAHDSKYITHLGGNQWNKRTQESGQVNLGSTKIDKLLGVRRP